MRVTIVSQYFPPEDARIPADVSSGLQASGHEVTVITGYPNYPQGKIYEGYTQRWRSTEIYAGSKIVRVPLYIDHSRSAFRRMLNYLSYGLSATSARKYARKSDVTYVYATQLTAGIGPWLWRVLGGAPYVLHIQDLWPDSIIGSSMIKNRFLASVIERVLSVWIKRMYRNAAVIIAIAPTMKDTLISRGVPESKVVTLYNWTSEDATRSGAHENPSKRVNSSSSLTTFVYAGNFGEMQDLETVVRAAAELPELCRLVLIGDGVMKHDLQRLVSLLEAVNVEIRNGVSRSELARVYASADFGLVTLKDLPAFHGTVPSKFQSLLENGIPVITTVQGDVKHAVENNNLGFTSVPENIDALSEVMREASQTSLRERREISQNCLKFAASNFSKDAALIEIEKILATAVRLSRKE